MPCTFDFILTLSKFTLHMDIHVQYIYWVLNSVVLKIWIQNFFYFIQIWNIRLKLSLGLCAHWIQVHLIHGLRVEFTKRSWCINKNRYMVTENSSFACSVPDTVTLGQLCDHLCVQMNTETCQKWNNIYKFVTTRLYVMIMWLYQIWIFSIFLWIE